MITNALVTAYCICKVCCGTDSIGIAANNQPPKVGITVAVPRSVKLGSRVTILGHTYIAGDRTSKKYDGRYDLFMPSHKKAKEFGIKHNVRIRVSK